MNNETNHLKLNKPKLEDHINLTIPALADNFDKIDKKSELVDGQLEQKASSNDLENTRLELAQTSNLTVKYYLDNPNKLKVGNTVLCNGFYIENDMSVHAYKVLQVSGSENFQDIGNGVLVGDDCSIRVSPSVKLQLITSDSAFIGSLGAKPNTLTIKSNIVINKLLNVMTEVKLGLGVYYLHGSVLHGAKSKIIGMGEGLTELFLADNVNQYPIKSPTSVLNNFTLMYDYFELSHLTLNGNNTKNNTRDYSGNVAQTYWGFGTLLTNIRHLKLNNLLVKNTEAWGLSYWLCETIEAEKLKFDQQVGSGTNKDGITGSAKYITIRDVKGYTDDDLIAITTGRGSLQGNDCGVTHNVRIENIAIENVQGVTKDEHNTWIGVGVYAHNADIVVCNINGITGAFENEFVRIADYWYTTGTKRRINDLRIENVSAFSKNRKAISLKDINLHSFITEKFKYRKDNEGFSDFITLNNTQIDSMFIKEFTFIENFVSVWGRATLVLGSGGSSITHATFDGISAINRTGNVNHQFRLCNLEVVRVLTVNNFTPIDFDNTLYTTTSYAIAETPYTLIGDKLPVNVNHIVNESSVTLITTKTGTIRGNQMCLYLDFTVNVANSAADLDIFDMSAVPYRLANAIVATLKAHTSDANMVIMYNATTKKLKLIQPNLNGVANGSYRLFVDIKIPLA